LIGDNHVAIAGRLKDLGALRRTPAGVAVIEFRLQHASEREEAGTRRAVEADIEAIAFETQARLVAAATLDSMMRVEGFLCARSRRSRRPVLHATRIEFIEGD
jgi:primosomal replication protein N